MKKYRVNDACQVTGLSRKTIYRKMGNGLLPYFVENGKRYVCGEDLAPYIQSSPTKTVSSNNTQKECVRLREEVTQLRRSVEKLTALVESMTQNNDSTNVTHDTAKRVTDKSNDTKTQAGDNAKRSEEAKQRLFTALDAMKEIPMYRGKPSITGIHKATGIDRGTVSKYLDEWNASKDAS